MKFAITHSFKCIGCGCVSEEKTNLLGGRIKNFCETCADQAMDDNGGTIFSVNSKDNF